MIKIVLKKKMKKKKFQKKIAEIKVKSLVTFIRVHRGWWISKSTQ